jgi:carbon starvation protein CstA
MCAASILLLIWQMENPDGFNTIWQYFGWGNQTLSVFTLWAITVYLVREKKPYIISLIPALFMTSVCSTFIFVSPQAMYMNPSIGYPLGALCTVIALIWFCVWYRKERNIQ